MGTPTHALNPTRPHNYVNNCEHFGSRLPAEHERRVGAGSVCCSCPASLQPLSAQMECDATTLMSLPGDAYS
jgi:hypothetical protein